MSDQPDTKHMTCMEVWGGSQLTTAGVSFGGLDAWVYSKPFGEAEFGGDVYYASSCATGRISRILLADVSGHGTTVAAMASDLRTLMRRFVNRLDQTEFVRLLNQQFMELSQDGSFATAVVTTFFAPSRRMIVCNAGHPRPFMYNAKQRRWDFLGHHAVGDEPIKATPSNIPLGMLDISDYEQFDVELESGDCVVSYTDALIESFDTDGEMLGEKGVLNIVRQLGNIDPRKLIEALLKEIRARHPGNLTDDDVTVLVVRATGRPPHHSFRDKWGAMARFARTLIAAIHPKAERPPFPDANLANIGGAIIPALGRRWRARRR
jgi:sigma-B regulation protein RsbU (phosphoserine phosphatase)